MTITDEVEGIERVKTGELTTFQGSLKNDGNGVWNLKDKRIIEKLGL